MAGLFVIGDATFNSLAVGSIIVVAVAVLGSITVLPALLAKLGRWVDRPRVPLLHRLIRRMRPGLDQRPGPRPGRPPPCWCSLLLATVVVVLLAIPALGMKTHSGNLETLPTLDPRGADHADLSTAFPSEGTTADLVVRATAAQQDDVAAALAKVEAAAEDVGRCSGRPGSRWRSRRTAAPRCSPLASRSTSPTSRVDSAIQELRSELAPPALDELRASSTPSAVTPRSRWTSSTASSRGCRW